MNYPSIEQQIHRNNLKSILLLLMFPLITLLAVWIFILLLQRYDLIYTYDTTGIFLRCVPIVLLIFAIWFLIAWLSNVWIINKVTRAKPLQREENAPGCTTSWSACVMTATCRCRDWRSYKTTD